uniref:Uncharacterized protein n=1 Tax=Anopheles dirus TaxID=7168 RepID=A0A182NYP6_9DIPT
MITTKQKWCLRRCAEKLRETFGNERYFAYFRSDYITFSINSHRNKRSSSAAIHPARHRIYAPSRTRNGGIKTSNRKAITIEASSQQAPYQANK